MNYGKIIFSNCNFLPFITNSKYSDKVSENLFFGYELLEMSMKKFQYFVGEIACSFNLKSPLRLMIGISEVKLPEMDHLPEKIWDEAKVLEHRFVNNIWFFVGINF